MISISTKGSYKKALDNLDRLKKGEHFSDLGSYASAGAAALARATPTDTGETANAWHGAVFKKGEKTGIAWYNTHVEHGIPIAVILDVGHGTGTGGWVAGRHYIDSAIIPVMDKVEADVWRRLNE